VFEPRGTLSYLGGPMGRDERRRALGARQPAAGHEAAAPAGATTAAPATPPAPAASPRATPAKTAHAQKPVLPADVQEFYLGGANAAPRRWVPVLYGSARIHYTDTKLGIDTVQDLNVVAPFGDGAVALDWDAAEPTDERPEGLLRTPPAGSAASFAELPTAALDARKYAVWTKDFQQWVQRAERLMLYTAPGLKATSTPGESERDFRVRLQQSARESRDGAVQKLRDSYAPKVARLTQRVQAAQEAIVREEGQAQQQRTQTMVSFGATVLGALLGRKAVSASTLGRATTAARGVGRTVKESQDVGRAQDRLREAEAELKALEGEIAEEVAALSAGDATSTAIETIEIRPKRGAVDVRLVALAWKPED